jgi:hypothetical protein
VFSGTQTKRPETEHQGTKRPVRQNARMEKKVWMDKTYGWIKRMDGQNVRMTKHMDGQNVWTDKTHGWTKRMDGQNV